MKRILLCLFWVLSFGVIVILTFWRKTTLTRSEGLIIFLGGFMIGRAITELFDVIEKRSKGIAEVPGAVPKPG